MRQVLLALAFGVLIGALLVHALSPIARSSWPRHGGFQSCDEKTGRCPPNLGQMLNDQKSDKAWRHGYHRFYQGLLPEHTSPVKLLEIGVSSGASFATWERFFTNPLARFYGISYVTKITSDIADARSTVLVGDQSNATFLKIVRDKAGPTVDVVIDDGSHLPSHMWYTLQQMWPLVKPGGYYVLEDCEESYYSKTVDKHEIYGYSLRKERSIFNDLFRLVHSEVNREYTHRFEPSVLPGVVSVQFGRNVIILRKAEAADAQWIRDSSEWERRLPKSTHDRLPGAAVCDCPP